MNTLFYFYTMIPTQSISTPTLLLDKKKCFLNISRMSEKAKKNQVTYRPHLKTPQSIEVGRWYREFGVKAVTVSSVRMAEYFAADGWQDITIAFPVNILEIEAINRLAGEITLNLLVESFETVDFLGKQLNNPVNIFIKVDTGYHRAGIASDKIQQMEELTRRITQSEKLTFKGLLTHAGHSYSARTTTEIMQIYNDTLGKMRELKKHFLKEFPETLISIGDTPTCSIAENFEGADEVRPGNLIFYDWKMVEISVCQPEQIAVVMACPVVSVHPERNEVILYGGSVHFSKDNYTGKNGKPEYGKIVHLTNDGWSLPEEGNVISSLSQEHGILSGTPEFISTLKPGMLVGALPAHSCLTADCMKYYLTTEGEKIEMLNLAHR